MKEKVEPSKTMKVRIKKIRGLSNELLRPFPIDNEPYPRCRNSDLPQPFFLAANAGSRGSGKTQLCCRMVYDSEDAGFVNEHGQELPVRTILISPTSQSNPIFKRLKTLNPADIHEKYSDASLLKLMEEIMADRLATRKYKQACMLWKEFTKLLRRDKDPLLIMKKDDLSFLSAQTNGFREEPVKPAHPLGQVVFLILDDCLSTDAMSLNRANKFSGFCMNSRHYWTSIIVNTQRLKALPPAIRSNLTFAAIWRTCSSKILLEEVWPQFSNILSAEQFLAYYEAATARNRWDSLTINTMAPDGMQIRRNLDEQLHLA